ncbi:MAG: dienelactone hydrolase family protein [Bryobacterales bacterium]|jgi:carboxymethylenebutenolidase|nr:dienelactone hydrolase family protein [Bryobacterales bacterium]
MHDEHANLLDRARDSRREMLAKVATGFALAAQPISAETITTGSDGLLAGDILIPSANGNIPAYRALPASGGNLPVVVVIPEIFGLHEHIKDVCRRLAHLGYFAIAHEPFFRHGDVTKLSDFGAIREIVGKTSDQEVLADLDAAVAFAGASGKANLQRIAVTGFCWGGRMVWLYTAHSARVKAGAAWYGRLVGQASELQPKHPVDVAANLNAPVLGLYGEEDTGIPLDTIDKMRAAATAGGKTANILVYPKAPHAFHADYRPSYREKDAKDAWAAMLAWFKKYGV